MPITLNTINFNSSALFGTGQLDGVRINASGNLELDRPGEFPYIELEISNGSVSAVNGGSIDITVTEDMLSDLFTSTNSLSVSEFAVVDDTNNVLYYWITRTGSLLTESDNLSIGDIITVQFKRKATNQNIEIESAASEMIKIRRYTTTNNMATGSEPDATVGFTVVGDYTSYHPAGTWLSPVLDLVEQPIDMNFSWVENIVSGSGARIDVDAVDPQTIEFRTSSSSVGLSSAGGVTVISDTDGNPVTYYMVTGDWGGLTDSDWILISKNTSVPETGRYLQFQVTLMI